VKTWPVVKICKGAEFNAKNRVSLQLREVPEIGNRGGAATATMVRTYKGSNSIVTNFPVDSIRHVYIF
jgi:hypothetical protein